MLWFIFIILLVVIFLGLASKEGIEDEDVGHLEETNQGVRIIYDGEVDQEGRRVLKNEKGEVVAYLQDVVYILNGSIPIEEDLKAMAENLKSEGGDSEELSFPEEGNSGETHSPGKPKVSPPSEGEADYSS